MEDLIVTVILAVILGGAALYVRREKKKRAKCIGCPCAGACGQCSCGGTEE